MLTPEYINQLVSQRIKNALVEYDEKLTEILDENAELKRRLDNSIRFGKVDSISDDSTKIKVAHGERKTPFIRWFTLSGGEMMHYRCPSVGESVLLLDTSCGMGAQGYVALCGFESDAFPFSDAMPKKIITKAGGMSMEWDLDSDTMTFQSTLIKFNDQNLAGNVTGFNKCSFTGLPHPDCSKNSEKRSIGDFMAISKTGMQSRIETKLTASGFDIENMHSSMKVFLKAVCEGVTEEINANAKANVTKGSSAGQYPIL